MSREVLDFFVRGVRPMPQPRPRGRVMFVGGKPTVHIYDDLKAYHPREPGKPRVRKDWDAEFWRIRIIERVRAEAASMPGPITGPVRLDCDFFFPRPGYMTPPKYSRGLIPHTSAPDRDNLEKLVMDAITQAGWRDQHGETIKTPLVWNDDGQVCEGEPRKFYAAVGDAAGVRIVVTQLVDEPSLFAEMAAGGVR